MTEQPAARVLVTDDEPLVLAVVGNTLELAGYHVIRAKNGPEALRLCREQEQPIDVALLDFFMPDMNGAELFDHLVAMYPSVKVIMMSGYTEQLFRKLGQDLTVVGVHDVLPKPFLPTQLIQKVRTALAGPPLSQ